MKHSSIKLFAISTLASVLAFAGCKEVKEKDPRQKCKNMVEATAIDPATTGNHFQLHDDQQTLLFINNIADYNIEPGGHYKIAFRYENCDEYVNMTQNAIVDGGCVVSKRCARLTCVEQLRKCETTDGCRNSLVNPRMNGFEKIGVVDAGAITGDNLDLLLGYSGCSEIAVRDLQLALEETPDNGPVDDYVFIASPVVNHRGEFICAAYFENKVCFDLTPLKSIVKTALGPAPEFVTIRVQLRDQTFEDFRYYIQ